MVDIEWYMDKEFGWYKKIFLDSLSDSSITAKSECKQPFAKSNCSPGSIYLKNPFTDPQL